MAAGIRIRHSRACAAKEGGACTCKPTYQAVVYDARTGRQLWRTAKTVSEARRWRSDAQAALRRGDLSADRGPTLNDALDRWLAVLSDEFTRSGEPYKPGTIRDYKRCIGAYGVRDALGEHRLMEIRTQDVQRWVDGVVAGRDGEKPSSATVDTALTPLKAFYRRAVVRGEARTNPTIGILKPAVRCKVKRVAAPAEVEAMIAAVDGPDRPLWATAFYGGLRRGELIGLRATDIDLATGVIRVERGWDMVEGEIPPKSKQGRRKVPIPGALRDHLDELLLDSDDGLLFGTPSWVALTNVRARERWEAAGLPVLTLHEARHSFASMMIAAGVNAKALSVFMGHANIGVTLNLYGHLFPGSEDEAAVLLDAYLDRARIVAREAAATPTWAPTLAHT